MKEHPLIFQTWKVQRILAWDFANEGNMQTRRLVKPRPQHLVHAWDDQSFYDCPIADPRVCNFKFFKCPYGVPGDLLWVREAWRRCLTCGRVIYRASSNERGQVCSHCDAWVNAWKPSIHMFREYSRLILELADMRCERLLDISEDDARREGVEEAKSHHVYPSKQAAWVSTYKQGFLNVWDAINKGRGFSAESNPYVWVLEFKRIKP